MRLLITILTLLMLCGLLGGILHVQRTSATEILRLEDARSEVVRFQREILLMATLKQLPLNEYGFPESIEPNWFEDGLPANPLLRGNQPWLEIAHEDQRHLTHPPNRAVMTRDDAQFWYNPRAGVVRGRVPSLPSDSDTLEMYNFINSSNVESLHEELPESLLR